MRAMVAVLIVALGTAACGGNSSGAPDEPQVVGAFYPLAWVAEQVGGEAVDVVNLTPAGVEPHDLELTPRSVGTITEADLLLYLGGGFQPAIEDLAHEQEATSLDLLEAMDLPSASEEAAEEPEEEEDHGAEEEGHGHEEGGLDPHVWLDPLRAIEIAEQVSARLAELAPEDAAGIERRKAAVVADLRSLHEEYEAGLRNCERREIVVSHDAFGYLADRYGLEQVSISGVDPEAEPSPGRIAEVAELAREHEVTTIFFERLVSPAIAETIASEVGVSTAVLDPLEGAPEAGDYLSAMRANLDALRTALDCR